MLKDVETRFGTSTYQLNRPLPKWKNKKKVIGLIKDELFEKIMKKFVGLRANVYSYLIHDGSEDKKAKSIKMCVTKRKHEFENYKNYLEATSIENKINHLEKHEIGKNCRKIMP